MQGKGGYDHDDVSDHRRGGGGSLRLRGNRVLLLVQELSDVRRRSIVGGVGEKATDRVPEPKKIQIATDAH